MSDAVGLENKVHHKVDHKVYHGMGTMFYNNPAVRLARALLF